MQLCFDEAYIDIFYFRNLKYNAVGHWPILLLHGQLHGVERSVAAYLNVHASPTYLLTNQSVALEGIKESSRFHRIN